MIQYFTGIQFHSYNRHKACNVWIDRKFPAYYAINFGTKGYIHWQNQDKAPERINAPVLWWTFPRIQYRYGCFDQVPWEHRWIAFCGKRAAQYVRSGLLPNTTQRPWVLVRDPDRVRHDFDALLDYLPHMSFGQARAVNMLESLLLHIHEQEYAPTPGRRYAKDMEDLAKRIQMYPEQDWDFKLQAAKLYLSYSHFRALFRNTFGTSPQDYVIKARLSKTAALLRAGNLSIKQIGRLVGVADVYYLSKLFKKHYGTAPSKYARLFQP